jgi:hypothetical protein
VTKLPASSAREALFSGYIAQVNKLRDGEKKVRLLEWADINDDASSEISMLLQNQNTDIGLAMQEGNGARLLVFDEEAPVELNFSRERLLALATRCDAKILKDAGDLLRYTRVRAHSFLWSPR